MVLSFLSYANRLFNLIISGGLFIYDFTFTPIDAILSSSESDIVSAIYNALSELPFYDFVGSLSFGTLILGSSLITIIYYHVAKFFLGSRSVVPS